MAYDSIPNLANSKYRSLIKDVPKFLSPLFSFVVLERILELKIGKSSEEFLFKLGKSIGNALATKITFINKRQKEAIIIFLKELENLGFGKSKIIRYNPNKNVCTIINTTNPLAKQYKMTFDVQKYPRDVLLAGMYSGCLSAILNSDCFFIEKRCITKNEQFCVFQLESGKIFKNERFDQKKIDQIISLKNLHLNYRPDYPNTLIWKIIQLRQIQLNDGELKIWGVYCTFFPVNIMLTIYKLLEIENIDISNELFYLGVTQSKMAILFQVNKFGIKNGLPTFNSLLNQLEFFGVGKGKLALINENSLEVMFKNNYSLAQYRLMFNDRYDNIYINGILAGMARYAFETEIESLSYQASKTKTDYKIAFTKNANNSTILKCQRGIKNKEIIKVIEEKMKHKYYLEY